MSSEPVPVESVQDIHVRLKPLFGIEPKYYLAVFYSLAILVLLGALLVLPGLTHPGTRVTVTSVPPGASVVYGEKHWGITPLTVFLPEGKGPLTISKPGFQPLTQELAVGNAVLFSLFFPRTDAVAAALKPLSPTSVADLARSEVGRWAMAAPFSSLYQFPPLFTRFVVDAQASGWEEAQIRQFLLDLRGAVADPQMYVDYGRALGLWGLEASPPEGLETQYRLWEPLVESGSGRLAFWLLANQPKPVRDRETTEPSDWLQARIGEFQALLQTTPSSDSAPASLKTSVGTFFGVGRSSFLWGAMGTKVTLPTEPPYVLPVPVTVEGFWMAEQEISQRQFSAFLEANPAWAPNQAAKLLEQGLVDEDYLKDWVDHGAPAPSEPVASISWYAAQAFVDWVNRSGQLPAGRRAVLPDDFQWEAAARTGRGELLNRGVWEWTASAWYPGQGLVWTQTAAPDELAYARSLKGGVQNPKGTTQAGDRAGWPASGSTPGLGFRLALVAVP